ncbi:uncharacterized protein LOC114520945 [Dendronephthya gigantea]|uniref:uncharacterized protein LOC114520945 n=1 Tax=Dendronephthya gigantea TaxID=151771 RepID=UPI001068F3EA|nr:uncharacterized protein LOC114520945 [Dendronephthya gigantea]
MCSSKDHNNWLTIGEIIRFITKPVALYTTKIIEEWYAKLPCLSLPQCTNPAVCLTKKDPRDLCHSCKTWYDELAKSHRNKDKRQIKWRGNCDTSKWLNDSWEVAKFFMSALGDNKRTVKDAESTDLSSLLNVLEWMKDAVFAPDRRVDRNLVIQLRSNVRHSWAHAPRHELPDHNRINAFDIAKKFLTDLHKVFNRKEVKECTRLIIDLKTNGITNVKETKLKNLELLSFELGGEVSQMKEELKRLKDDQTSDRQVIESQEEELENLKIKYKSLQTTIKSLQDIVNVQVTGGQFQLKSSILDKPQIFIGRDIEVNEIISSLVKNDCGIVCIVGGPGFGKSTVAVEVFHHLRNTHDFVVIFSYLRNVSTLSDVILHLCRDIGINSGENPESSLMLWLRSINEKRVVLVMDNIEQLLESNEKHHFDELLFTLRKNSQQYLQFLATTRTEFTIPNQQTIAINKRIKVFDEQVSVELLRKCCPSDEMVEDKYLSDVAELCGFLPLALCLAGKRIQDLDDPSKLTKWLRKKPMETLKPVQQAFEFSFQMLKDEEQKALVRLSVFDGNFRSKSAKKVIEKNSLETQDFLENLVARSLIESSSDKRFVIHSLIRRFLADNDSFQHEKAAAQEFMVSHFLHMCHSWTWDCYSPNGFTGARESLKKDIHNVEKTLKICSQDRETNPNIPQLLRGSDIYIASARFFYNFSWDLLPVTVLRSFFESCMKLAESRPCIEILFKCLVADQEGRKSAWKSQEYFERMEDIKAAFYKNEAVMREDRALFMFSYHSFARYDLDKETSATTTNPQEDDVPPLLDDKEASTKDKVAEAHILMERGNLKKKRANVFRKDKERYDEYMNSAKLFYDEALSLSKDVLGDHELTCILNKLLGDLFLNLHKNEEALGYYTDAVNLRKTMKLDSNEAFVFLLKNCGVCLAYLCRFDESVKRLEEARDIADKLAEKNTRCRALVYYQLAITYSDGEIDSQEAVKYAKMAMEIYKLLDPRNVKDLETIIEKAGPEENVAL